MHHILHFIETVGLSNMFLSTNKTKLVTGFIILFAIIYITYQYMGTSLRMSSQTFLRNKSSREDITTSKTLHTVQTEEHITKDHLPAVSSNAKLKTILLWNKFFSFKHFEFYDVGHQIFIDGGCTIKDCRIVDNMDGPLDLPVEEYDAILIHTFRKATFPDHRKPHQRYVFVLYEPPAHAPVEPYEDIFNWTMTHRRDSDIYRPYGWIANRTFSAHESPTPEVPHWIQPEFSSTNITLEDIKHKDKLVAWFVSNCAARSKRLQYVRQLAKHIPIDVYGKCGQLECPRSRQNECFKLLQERYKFYSSFENSLCKDYVTEKIFNVLKYDVVPIVYGGVNYSEILPPMSYIDVKDFKSYKELSEFILYLDKHPDEYQKYFWWKNHYKINTNYIFTICELCAMLHNVSLPHKVYHNMATWWQGGKMCQRPEEFFKNTDIVL